MIALHEKLMLDFSKGIYKVAQIIRSGFGSPNLRAILQHASKQKMFLKSGNKCRLHVSFFHFSFIKTGVSEKFSFPSVDLNMHAEFSSGTPYLESGVLQG